MFFFMEKCMTMHYAWLCISVYNSVWLSIILYDPEDPDTLMTLMTLVSGDSDDPGDPDDNDDNDDYDDYDERYLVIKVC